MRYRRYGLIFPSRAPKKTQPVSKKAATAGRSGRNVGIQAQMMPAHEIITQGTTCLQSGEDGGWSLMTFRGEVRPSARGYDIPFVLVTFQCFFTPRQKRGGRVFGSYET